MKRSLLFFLVLMTTFVCIDAQSLLKKAEEAYKLRNYSYAIEAYEKIYAKRGELSSVISIPLANCYYYMNEYDNARKYFDKTPENDMSARDWLNYGDMFRKQGLYREALAKYKKAISSRNKNISYNRILLSMKACTGDPSSRDRVGPAEFSSDGKTIYYTKLAKVSGVNRYQIFTAQLNSQRGEWEGEKRVSFCNDAYNYAYPALSLDGKTLFFSSDMPGSIGDMDIFKVERSGSSWGEPKNLGDKVNTEAAEVYSYITSEGYLSFASNGYPGYGGMDAFWGELKDGQAVAVKYVSLPINGSSDDYAAVLNPEDLPSPEELAAQSGYDDIFALVSPKDSLEEQKRREIDSLKQVVYEDSIRQVQVAQALSDSLAKADSIALAQEDIAAADSSAVIVDKVAVDSTENEFAQVEEEVIDKGEAFVPVSTEMLFGADELGIVSTFLVNGLSSQMLKNAAFVITDNITEEEVLSGVADDSAKVVLDLKSAKMKKGQALTVTASVEYGDFSSYSFELVADRMRAYDATHPIILTPIMAKRDKVKKNIVANEDVTGGPPFAFDACELTPEGKKYLDAWVDFLQKNPNVKIKLMTHTDSRGEVAYNFKLSQRRAYEAKRYLMSKGVGHMQVVARGYGERYPLVDCRECTEKEHGVNRRIEVEVINSK